MKEQSVEDYLDGELRRAYGGEDYQKIMNVLANAPNGFCGVELNYRTIPLLLKARGISPAKSYEQEWRSVPKDDGEQAATPEQQNIIKEALRKAGFPV